MPPDTGATDEKAPAVPLWSVMPVNVRELFLTAKARPDDLVRSTRRNARARVGRTETLEINDGLAAASTNDMDWLT